MKKSVQNYTIRALSLSIAFQLVASTGVARAEGDTISNTAVPMETPSSSRLVKKIWGSLDLRKLKAAKAETRTKPTTTETTTTSTPAARETPVATQSQTNDDSRIRPEAQGWSSPAASSTEPSGPVGATSTAPQAAKPTLESAAPSPAEQAAVPAAEPPGTDAATTGLAPVAQTTSTNSTPTATTEATTAPAAAATTTAQATGSSSESSPTFTVGNTGRVSIASQVLALPPGSVLRQSPILSDQPLVVDSDEAEEVEETLKYEDLPTDEGKTKVKAGAKFPIVITSQVSSKTAKKGDPFQGRLKFDLKIGDRLIATKGSIVNGHINYVLKARTILGSIVTKDRFYRNSGVLGLAFDEVVTEKGEHLPLKGQPARASRIVKNKAEGRELGVNHLGQVTGPWGPQLRHKAIRVGLNFALAPAGVFSFGAMPVALGVIGAVNPNFAFSKPVGLNVRHRRIKGFAWGFLSGVPGSWLIEDTTVRGQEAIIKPGDEFYAEFTEEFNGEPASDAQLMPGASTKLRGQVLTDPKKDKKKK
ncbi:MAG: hypothetical protein K2W95_27455 [Candidatus Obscuribacterales bacterium]|nr:hypothetical protein [Candidatus Obscuribacterales bacterium]